MAFPSISTGAYGYPVEKAAEVALETVRQELLAHPGVLDEVRFVLFDDWTLDAYRTGAGGPLRLTVTRPGCPGMVPAATVTMP